MIIIILKNNCTEAEKQKLLELVSSFHGVTVKTNNFSGQENITEIQLIGNTAGIAYDRIEAQSAVANIYQLSDEHVFLGKAIGKSGNNFTYNGVNFSQNSFNVFAGLCAVDNKDNVAKVFKVLQDNQQQCARMGAYKPRTSPHAFQGLAKNCLPYVFELAGKYDIKVIAMEITKEEQIAEITHALEQTGNATGVMLQIGTRNAQNFELLKAAGSQKRFPLLIKRGYGLTIDESISACEYAAKAGNQNIIFCLRGVKTELGLPHRNLVDFAFVPTIKRLTTMPVCIDPSHSVGIRDLADDGIMDLCHATASGVIAGANMVLVDFHPQPETALVDGKQAIKVEKLPWFLEDVMIAREAYLKRTRKCC